jgi:hypothetical protein
MTRRYLAATFSIAVAGALAIAALLVKEILVDTQSITIRHSIPIPPATPVFHEPQPSHSTPS